MKPILSCVAFALALITLVPAARAEDKWLDGKVTYKIGGVDTHFAAPADACKAGVAVLVKQGNKKTFVSVKDGTSSTMMTCVVKESDGELSEQTNIVTKILECPDTTSARSTDNSGEFAKIRCKCDRKGCPIPGAKTAAKIEAKPAVAGNWMDGKLTFKIGGVDTHFAAPADACKAGVAVLVKQGNKKTFDSVKDGTSSTTMTCVLKESDGSIFEQANIVTKVLECPDTTSARSTDNSGEFASIRCKCENKGCPPPGAKPAATTESKPALEGNWIDGKVTYKVGGIDTHFAAPAAACKANVAALAKQGNKKTFVSVKDGTSSTMMTCVVKESGGDLSEQTNIVTKVLECPATTSARSTDNSGEFSAIRCKCGGKSCPKK